MSYSIRPNDYLTTAEASQYLNVTRFTVLNWIKSGKLQSASTYGGHSRIPRGVLEVAMRQIKTTNPVSPKPQETPGALRCWESKEIKELNCKRQCNQCLVYKKKFDFCFLAVKQYGALKVECQQDCLNCAYLANHHPQERKMLVRQRNKTIREAKRNEDQSLGVNGILKKVFYNSGRLVAKIGQLSAQPKPRIANKRKYKKNIKSI